MGAYQNSHCLHAVLCGDVSPFPDCKMTVYDLPADAQVIAVSLIHAGQAVSMDALYLLS